MAQGVEPPLASRANIYGMKQSEIQAKFQIRDLFLTCGLGAEYSWESENLNLSTTTAVS